MKKTLTAFSVLLLMAGPLAAQDATTASPDAIRFATEQSQAEVLATDFTGRPVVTASGERIGSVANLVFDPSGRISLAVIGVGGFMGLGAKEVAVPFDSLSADTREGREVLVVNTTKEQLQAAPAYQTLNDQRFQERLAVWKEKAKEGWQQVSERAKEAYDQAKDAVGSAQQSGAPAPSGEPATRTN
jgi:sporulation protein YlmC with PRC-barrel domain